MSHTPFIVVNKRSLLRQLKNRQTRMDKLQ